MLTEHEMISFENGTHLNMWNKYCVIWPTCERGYLCTNQENNKLKKTGTFGPSFTC